MSELQTLNIVLVDISLDGHRLSFNRAFSKILLNLGCRVFLLVPGSASLIPWIKREATEHIHNFYPVDYAYVKYSCKKPGRFQSLWASLKQWKLLGQHVKIIEGKYDVNVDLVFFSWVDNMLAPYMHSFLLDKVFPWKWSGLYFHPYHLRRQPFFIKKKLSWRDIDSPLLSNRCIGVCVHDRAISDSLQRYRYNKRVYTFPETADCSPPDVTNQLAKQIRELAAGRVVVGLIGCEPHKGVELALDLAILADPSRYFFAFLGNVSLHSFSQKLLDKWRKFFQKGRENCFSSFGHIDEGPSYNAVFTAIDIHFMVYQDFVSSSNRLTKAAALSRFVLASDQHCIGDDVRAFNLGETVPPGDVKYALKALERLNERIVNSDFPYNQWHSYSRLNSEEDLNNQFSSLISSLRH